MCVRACVRVWEIKQVCYVESFIIDFVIFCGNCLYLMKCFSILFQTFFSSTFLLAKVVSFCCFLKFSWIHCGRANISLTSCEVLLHMVKIPPPPQHGELMSIFYLILIQVAINLGLSLPLLWFLRLFPCGSCT